MRRGKGARSCKKFGPETKTHKKSIQPKKMLGDNEKNKNKVGKEKRRMLEPSDRRKEGEGGGGGEKGYRLELRPSK